jgi:hypothetical protein
LARCSSTVTVVTTSRLCGVVAFPVA